MGWEEVTTEAESGDGEVQRPTIESVDAIAEMGDEAGEESPHGGRSGLPLGPPDCRVVPGG